MIVMKEKGLSHTSLETISRLAGPHGTDQGQSGGRKGEGRHGPEGMSETG